ncbi:MAG: ribosome recycling factor [Bacteroidales bacterium]|nr:ribosome recycling factor [Bacteroidales bacterium]
MTRAKQILASAKDKMSNAVNHLDEELKTYRAGKANPLVFNNVMVDYYGSPTPVPQVASVTTPDAKTLMLQPWEKKMIPAIEKAILDANIGLTPSNNGESIRCTVPPLTEDRRKELLKKAKGAGENAKVSVRNARRDAIEQLKKANKEGMPEDLQKEYEQLVQKETDAFSKKVDELVVAKEKEMMTV